jgi:hypothetical protein
VCRISLSCFALLDTFSAVPRASGPVFMFYTPRLIFCGTDGTRSHFHVILSRIRLRRCRGCRVPFSYFTLPDSFWDVPTASGPVFMFCAPVLAFDGTEGVRSRFSCFVLLDSFSAVLSVSGPVFMFCAPRLILSGFHVLRSSTRFGRYRGHRVPFLCFCAPTHILGGTRGVESCFHILRS